MLNKTKILNAVYAIGLFGAITSCIGFLNEIIMLIQLYKKTIPNLATYTKNTVTLPLIFYSIAFVLGVFIIALSFLYLSNVLKEKHINIINVCTVLVCIILLILLLLIIPQLKYFNEYTQDFRLSYANYLTSYTYHSGIMSFIASSITMLICNIIHSSTIKKEAKNASNKQENQPIE